MYIKQKIYTVVAVCAVLSAVLSGCISGASSSESTPPYIKVQATTSVNELIDDYLQSETEPPTTPFTPQYKDIYDEFSEALMSKTAVLVSEIKSAADNESVLYLIEEKENELLQILNEGLAEFLKVLNSSDDATYVEYEYWSARLEAVYEDELSSLESNFDYLEDPYNNDDIDY